MIIAVLLLFADVAVPSHEEAREAIVADVLSTAMLGGGNNAATWEWVRGADGIAPPQLEIHSLACERRKRELACNFYLERRPARNAGPGDLALPRRLSCHVNLALFDDGGGVGWHVVRHMAPHNRGPALTTMACEPSS
jgi:hypothetical protein